MAEPIRRLCVFCAASPGTNPVYVETAFAVGALLAREGITVVYGGGRIGLMGAVADGALSVGGQVIGIIPRMLMAKELGHPGIAELRIVETMHQRKGMMADLSDGFLALPGGWGTFEELFEIVTWAQLGIHAKPCAALNVAGYYDHFVGQLDRAMTDGLIRPENRGLLMVGDEPVGLLERMRRYEPPPRPHWLDERQR